ncbi:MAG: ribonuclease HI [Christensenellaceae bacterium]|nr:ribonuclease HI [Christensenellaceae bacterium]
MKTVQIYTDGACSGNPGPGGWACVLLFGEHKKELSGFEPDTTNNRMEILATVKALEALKESVSVELFSDSSYLVNAVNNGWLDSWQQNGWRTSAKESVKNRDLWERIIELNAKFKPKYVKVKGHADNKYNNRCDELAVDEIKKKK